LRSKRHPRWLDPTIPASSPYITAVGGTQFVPAVAAAAVPGLQAKRSSLLGGRRRGLPFTKRTGACNLL
jgi:subtilase family serine protease